ncbi:Apoptotic chromatin condensation inducer in the nucleus [Coemansia sp. Benny D115]|nr:Apoptotic chromatin condensation inducer in the nucleus [Coemansia sp. Benny D115]
MTELIPSELKVADLRKELQARNLPTNGLKKDLVERLEEALKINADPEPSEPVETGNQAGLDLAAPVGEQDDVDMEGTADMEAGPVDNMETEENGLKRKSDNDDENEDERERGDSLMSDSQADSQQQQQSQAGAETEGTLSSNDERMDSIYIKHLARPLTVPRLRELLGKHAEADEVWLNSIKTRGYASFKTNEQVNAVFAGINGTCFPPEHGNILECGLITADRMKALIADEERMNDSVFDNDLIAVPVEGDNCGVALVNTKAKAKNAAKKQKTEKEQRGVKPGDKSVAIVAAAATAAANDASRDSKLGGGVKEISISHTGSNGNSAQPAKTLVDDEFTLWTKTTPSISYRPLTEEEIAAKKSAAAGAADVGASAVATATSVEEPTAA